MVIGCCVVMGSLCALTGTPEAMSAQTPGPEVKAEVTLGPDVRPFVRIDAPVVHSRMSG